jgi:hypothetical protein
MDAKSRLQIIVFIPNQKDEPNMEGEKVIKWSMDYRGD